MENIVEFHYLKCTTFLFFLLTTKWKGFVWLFIQSWVFACLFVFHLYCRSHILCSGKHRKAQDIEYLCYRYHPMSVCLAHAQVKAHTRGRRRRWRRRKRGSWRGNGTAGPCVMCHFVSVSLLWVWDWNARKVLVCWIRSHVNSCCQLVITPFPEPFLPPGYTWIVFYPSSLLSRRLSTWHAKMYSHIRTSRLFKKKC
jgi:hypothetical protein